MDNWQYDFDDSLDDSNRGFLRSLLPYLLTALIAIILVCLLLVLASHWSVTAPLIRTFLGDEKKGGVDVIEPISSSPATTAFLPTPTLPAEKTSKHLPSTPTTEGLQTAMPSQPSSTSDAGSFYPPDFLNLQTLMLSAINRDREDQGLSPVKWDEKASLAGQLHTEDMLKNNYFSHWNVEGYGPDHRYALIGGTDAVAENIHMYWQRFDNGDPVPFSDWNQIILDAEESLMNSPGHRKNILDPAHTHVGVGIAYDAKKGEMRLAQEFLNHYLEIDPVPSEIHVGDVVTISGRSLVDTKKLLVNLAYQSFPPSPSRANLQDGSYLNASEVYDALTLFVENGRFERQISINYDNHPGIYSVRIWMNLDDDDEMTIVSTVMLWTY